MILSLYKIGTPWFVTLIIIAIAHQLLEKVAHVNLPFADSYLDPLLLMPILLQLLLWEKRILFKRGNQYVFSILQLFLYFVLISFIAEYLFPMWNKGFTADIWDVICYGIGTLVFGMFFNKPYGVKSNI